MVRGMAEYPPEPWELRGQLHASVLLVPARDVPLDLPAGCRPVRLGRHAIVGVVWVEYEPGGVLDYRELMATALLRRGLRPVPSVVAIWVDSPASREGGRALWGIPKELARFAFEPGADGTRFHAWDPTGGIALGTVRRLAKLPGRWPIAFSLAQRFAGGTKHSPVRARAGVELGSATFDPDPTGPLRWLVGHRPWLTVTLRDFEMSFGASRTDAAADSAAVTHN